MKTRTLFLAAFMVLVAASVSTNVHAEEYYYWYKDQKISLILGDKAYVIYQDDLLKESDKAQIEESEDLTSYPEYSNLKWGKTVSNPVLEDTEHILYQTPSLVSERPNVDIFITHRFYIKLKEEADSTVLQQVAEQYNAEIVMHDGTLVLWYVLQCPLKSEYNALLLANIFFESGLFQVAQPEFLGGLLPAEGLQTTDAPVSKSTKLFRDGQLIIQNGDKTFNALGVEIK